MKLSRPRTLLGLILLGLALLTLPLLLAGRVVDARGAPVRQAWLSISATQGAGDEQRWFNLDGPRVVTDRDGAFAVHGAQPLREVGRQTWTCPEAEAGELRVLLGCHGSRRDLERQHRSDPAAGHLELLAYRAPLGLEPALGSLKSWHQTSSPRSIAFRYFF